MSPLTTGSELYNNGHNYTGVGLSTQIIIKVNGNPVGAIQTLSVRENRTITMVDEVGTDGHIDSAPTKSTDISGTCRRVRFNRMRVSEALGRDFLHTHAQRIPFDIEIYDTWLGDGSKSIVTVIKNVWIQNLSYDYGVDNWLVFDTMEWVAEAISSNINGGNVVTRATAQVNQFELDADKGSTRGTMSSPGLIDDWFSSNG